MSDDVECPYCGKWQEICHDDGQGFAEDELHEQECGDCEKTFVFTTFIHYSYDARIANCLNGAEHNYKPTSTYPLRYTKMECVDCWHRREPTVCEMTAILKEHGE